MIKKVFLFSLIFISVLALTSCTNIQGDGFIPGNKLSEYGFLEMPKPQNITDEKYIITDGRIEYSGMMTFDDFQICSANLYQYYYQLEDIKVLGYLTDRTSIGLFTSIYITLGNELPLLDDENIENTSVNYYFAFSTVEQSGTGPLEESRIIHLSYSPVYSVNGSNVKITLIRGSLTSVYIAQSD